MTSGQIHEESLIVPCSKCGVGIGEYCKWGEGLGRMEACHLRRMIDARSRIESLPHKLPPERSSAINSLGRWSFKAAYSREEVDRMVRKGEISERRGEELLRENAPVVAEKTAPTLPPLDPTHEEWRLAHKEFEDWMDHLSPRSLTDYKKLTHTDICEMFRIEVIVRRRQIVATEARNQELMGMLTMPPLRAYVFTQIGDEAYYKAEDVRRWFDQLKEEHHG